MKILFKLALVQLKQLLNYNATAGKRKRNARSLWLMLAMISGLALYIGGLYSFQMAANFAMLGALDLIFVIMSFIAVLFSSFILAVGASGILFQAKDMGFLLSMPLSAHKVLLAKLTAMYAEAFLINFFMLAPTLVAYLRRASLPLASYPLFIVLMLLLPLLACSLSLIFGYLFSLLQARTKNTPMVSNVVMLGGVGLLMYASFKFQRVLIGENLNPSAMRASMLKYVRPLYWVRDVLVDNNLLSLLLMALVTVVPLYLLSRLMANQYLRLSSGLSTRSKSTAYRGPSSQKSPWKALLRKEWKQYFATPAYFINTIIGPLILIAAAIYALVQQTQVKALIELLDSVGAPVGLLLVVAMVGVNSINNTTAPSISLEGSRLWILKTLPVSTLSILHTKLFFNWIIVLPSILIGAGVINYLFPLSLSERILVFVLPFLAMASASLSGLIANLIFPKLDAPSDTAAVKNSASVFIGSFGVMLTNFIILGLNFWFYIRYQWPVLYILTAFYLILALGLYQYVRTAGVRRFEKLI